MDAEVVVRGVSLELGYAMVHSETCRLGRNRDGSMSQEDAGVGDIGEVRQLLSKPFQTNLKH